jgi:hypothetical protein
VPDCQQRQYTFLSPLDNLSMVATLGESRSILLLILSCRRAELYDLYIYVCDLMEIVMDIIVVQLQEGTSEVSE